MCCWCIFLTRGRLETASLISDRRTWRWTFLGALWYRCFLLEHRNERMRYFCRQQRWARVLRRHPTCFGSPPPEGRRRLLDAAPPWRTPPTTASRPLPSTGCKSFSHTAQPVQPGQGAACRQNTEDAFAHPRPHDLQQHTQQSQQRLPNLAFWTKEGVCGDTGVWLHRARIQQRRQDCIRHIYTSVRTNDVTADVRNTEEMTDG